ncbi:DNA-directed RNA polymerase subunit beta [Paenibacillus sp. MMS18-CY102]|nr:DNA-directed RNA polymerase subunit beta [Paenibacillus sp. MMS18-CY102]
MLRWAVVPILLFWATIAGLYVGYSVLGKQPSGEVFQVETWKHVYDLIFSDADSNSYNDSDGDGRRQ